jgi:hypothetical protein
MLLWVVYIDFAAIAREKWVFKTRKAAACPDIIFKKKSSGVANLLDFVRVFPYIAVNESLFFSSRNGRNC